MCAVTNVAVFFFFGSSFMSYFLGMLLRYFSDDFEMLLIDPVITDITFVFAFHTHCISIAKLSSSSSSSSAHRQMIACARSWANCKEIYYTVFYLCIVFTYFSIKFMF